MSCDCFVLAVSSHRFHWIGVGSMAICKDFIRIQHDCVCDCMDDNLDSKAWQCIGAVSEFNNLKLKGIVHSVLDGMTMVVVVIH